MSAYEHLHQDTLPLMAMSAESRVAALDGHRWVGYDRAKTIFEMLDRLLVVPERPRMQSLLIVGESNNGKTSLIREYRDRHLPQEANETGRLVMPVLLTEVAAADERGLYAGVLERMFAPFRITDPLLKLQYQVIHLMRECRVRMLIIDEIHTLLTGTPKKQREMMNALKFLSNTLCVSIVGVGTRDAVRVLHTDPQHASRFDVIDLPLWSCDASFQQLLATIEKRLPLQKASRLFRPELARRLHAYTQGNLGNLYRLLVACTKAAILSGDEQITADLIDRHKDYFGTKGKRDQYK